MSNPNIRDSMLKINMEYKRDIENLCAEKIALQKLVIELENENIMLKKKIEQLKKELQEEKEWS